MVGEHGTQGDPKVGAGDLLHLPLALVDFDPAQPRRSIDSRKLAELAASMRTCGVIQPIVVHASDATPGRFVVIVGERRVRAARMAGLESVPALLREARDAYAQVIENLAREALSPFDLAAFVREREIAGDSRVEIARRLGKTAPFITEVAMLADAPAAVRRIHEAGRCADVRVLYGLCRAYTGCGCAESVERLAEGRGPVTRGHLRAIAGAASRDEGLATEGARASWSARRRRRVGALLVDVAGRLAFLPLRAQSQLTRAQVVFEDGSRETIDLRQVRLIQWTSLGASQRDQQITR